MPVVLVVRLVVGSRTGNALTAEASSPPANIEVIGAILLDREGSCGKGDQGSTKSTVRLHRYIDSLYLCT